MRDRRWQELTDDECRKLLGERHLGRLAFVDADGPVILPVNYTLDQGLSVTGRRIALPAELPFTWWG